MRFEITRHEIQTVAYKYTVEADTLEQARQKITDDDPDIEAEEDATYGRNPINRDMWVWGEAEQL